MIPSDNPLGFTRAGEGLYNQMETLIVAITGAYQTAAPAVDFLDHLIFVFVTARCAWMALRRKLDRPNDR